MSRSVNLQYSTICMYYIYTGKHQMAIIVRVKDSKVAAVVSAESRHRPLTSSMIASREVGAVNDEIMASSVNMAACPYTHR